MNSGEKINFEINDSLDIRRGFYGIQTGGTSNSWKVTILPTYFEYLVEENNKATVLLTNGSLSKPELQVIEQLLKEKEYSSIYVAEGEITKDSNSKVYQGRVHKIEETLALQKKFYRISPSEGKVLGTIQLNEEELISQRYYSPLTGYFSAGNTKE